MASLSDFPIIPSDTDQILFLQSARFEQFRQVELLLSWDDIVIECRDEVGGGVGAVALSMFYYFDSFFDIQTDRVPDLFCAQFIMSIFHFLSAHSLFHSILPTPPHSPFILT